MNALEPTVLIPSRLYPLRLVRESFGVDPFAIISAAAEGKLGVCVPVPAGKRVFLFDLSDIRYPNKDFGIELPCHLRRWRPPALEQQPVMAGVGIVALLVPPHSCAVIHNYGRDNFRFFSDAFVRDEGVNMNAIGKGNLRAFDAEADPYDDGFVNAEDVDVDINEKPQVSIYTGTNCLGIYSENEGFPFSDGFGFSPPEELELSVDTVCITGSNLGIYLSEYHTKTPAETSEKTAGEEKAVARIYPPAIPKFSVPASAPYRVKMLYDIAKRHWKGKRSASRSDHQRIQKDVLAELTSERDNGPIKFTDTQIVLAAGLIRPLWARGTNHDIANSRGSEFVTPEFEKMVLVIATIEEWHKKQNKPAKAGATKKLKGKRKHPPNNEVADWLSSSDHFSVSHDHFAPIAVKLLRSEPGRVSARGSRKKRGR